MKLVLICINMEGRAFPLKKLITLCAACLLALSGCTGGETPSPSPTPPETVSPTPLTVETPAPTATTPPPPTETPSPVTPTVEPTPTETLPVETTPVTTAAPLDWDGDPDSLTLNDFPTQLSSGTDVADRVSALEEDQAGLYLVCQLPEQDTWLYGFAGPGDAQGLILRVGAQWQALDLTFPTSQNLMPAMAYGDYDRDGDQELAIVNFLGDDTGVNVWGLSVVDFSSGSWEFFHFEAADYNAILDLSLSSTYDAETDTLTLHAGDASLALSPTELGYPGLGPEMEAALGHWVLFTTEGDAILATFGITLWAEGMPYEGVHAAMLHANVVYTGSAFGLGTFSFSLPEF